MVGYDLQVGAARVQIEIPETLFPYEGFHGMHDPLYVRTLVLDNSRRRFVCITVDLTSITRSVSDRIRSMCADTYGLRMQEVVVLASHTFQAPHMHADVSRLSREEAEKNTLFTQSVFASVERSIKESFASLQPGRMGFGQGSCSVNINRDALTSQGWWIGANAEGISDKCLALVQFETLEGKMIACMVNYAVQSNVLQDSIPLDGRPLVSSDLCGEVLRYIENQYNGEMVALWSVGGAGDQDPVMRANRHHIDEQGKHLQIDLRDTGYAIVERLGQQLGIEAMRIGQSLQSFDLSVVLETMESTVVVPGQKIFGDVHAMGPTTKYHFEKTGPREVPFSIHMLGQVALIALEPELVSKTVLEIKERSPFAMTMVMTMANGSAKYLPDEQSYDKITYAAMNSFGAKGAAEIVRDAIGDVLDKADFVSAEEGVTI